MKKKALMILIIIFSVTTLRAQDVSWGLFFFNHIEDGLITGKNKETYNISVENFCVGMDIEINNTKNQTIRYRAFDITGECIGESLIDSDFYICLGPETEESTPLDFLDMIKKYGPGRYKIEAFVEATGQEFSRGVTIVL